MNYTLDNNNLIINLEGRIDAHNADLIKAEIENLIKTINYSQLIFNLKNLSYLSSAGIRIFLLLHKKEENGIKITEVSRDVFDIFDMTGLTSIIPISRAKRNFNIENLNSIGRGVTGIVYQYDDDTLIKVFNSGMDLQEIQNERDNAQKVFLEGISTAIPYDVIETEDNRYGIVYELIGSGSYLNLIQQDLNNLKTNAYNFGKFIREVNDITPDFPFKSQKEKFLEILEKNKSRFSDSLYDKIKCYLESIPESKTFSHGDLHPGNVLLQNKEPILIDLATIGLGHPVFDLVSLYSYSKKNGLPNINNDSYIDRQNGLDAKSNVMLFDEALKGYLGSDDPKLLEKVDKIVASFVPIRVVLILLDFYADKGNNFINQAIENNIKQIETTIDDNPVFIDF